MTDNGILNPHFVSTRVLHLQRNLARGQVLSRGSRLQTSDFRLLNTVRLAFFRPADYNKFRISAHNLKGADPMSHSLRLLVRGALLLAIGALSQQLRLVLPLPVPVMTLLIGTLVNAVLVLAGRYTTRLLAWVICVALAVIAFFQGHILGPVVPVIALGNGMYVELTRSFTRGPVLFLGAPLGKAVVLGISMVGALHLLQLPWAAISKTLALFLPLQLATGILGLFLAKGVEKRLQRNAPAPQPPSKRKSKGKQKKK